MIKTFKSKLLKNFWQKGRAKGIDPKSAERLEELLSALDVASKPEDMNVPGWGFHALTGNRKGQYAVEIRAQYRLVFEWENGQPVRVNEEDYPGT